jgi:uncharacterized RDD family membrane protein YckC
MEPDKGLLGQYAGFSTRLLALLIDVVLLVAAAVLLSVTANSLLGVFGVDIEKCADVTRGRPMRFVACWMATRSLPVIQVSIIPMYYVVAWTLSGQTLGKAALGIRVVRINGRPMGLITAAVRYVGYGVSLMALGLGFFWILVDDRRQGWHDKMARTCVIYTWDARTDEYFLWRVVNWVQRRRGPKGRPRSR